MKHKVVQYQTIGWSNRKKRNLRNRKEEKSDRGNGQGEKECYPQNEIGNTEGKLEKVRERNGIRKRIDLEEIGDERQR